VKKVIAAKHTGRTTLALAMALSAAGVMAGCEGDSFFDPSVVGSWEPTPVVVPILDRIDIIEPTDDANLPVTPVQPADLIPDLNEYRMGPGDFITVSIYELLGPGAESLQNREISETGKVRLPVVGEMQAAGKSVRELEDDIIQKLEDEGILKDATVSVVVQQSRSKVFSVLSFSRIGDGAGTRVGTYVIPKPDFRLLDAIALAGGISGRVKTLLIFRQTALTPEVAGQPTGDDNGDTGATEPAPRNPLEAIEGGLEGGGDVEGPVNGNGGRSAPPSRVEGGLDSGGPRYVWINGEFVRVDSAQGQSAVDSKVADSNRLKELGQLISQRIVEVPYDRLKDGDMRYNIVIRPGDIIRVPDPAAGFVYVMGAVNRPGAYTVPGQNELTLMRLIASSGNLTGIAEPRRVDLVRMVGDSEQAMVRLDLRQIFEGRQPDIFLKPNDLINVGTSWTNTPIAIMRSGFRVTYGFGFILDRNFADDVFGNQNN